MPHQQGREHPPFVFSSSATLAFAVGSGTGPFGVTLTHEDMGGEDVGRGVCVLVGDTRTVAYCVGVIVIASIVIDGSFSMVSIPVWVVD